MKKIIILLCLFSSPCFAQAQRLNFTALGTSVTVVPNTVADSSGTYTPAFAASNTFKINMVDGETVTIANPSGTIRPGTDIVLEIKQSAAGTDTVTTWGTYYKFPAGTAPTLSTTANYTDIVACHVLDATHLACNAVVGFAQ